MAGMPEPVRKGDRDRCRNGPGMLRRTIPVPFSHRLQEERSMAERTPLFSWHSAHGARMVDFAGWDMPVQYTSIVEEHTAVRSAAGLFDISHMGRLTFTGPDALALIQ